MFEADQNFIRSLKKNTNQQKKPTPRPQKWSFTEWWFLMMHAVYITSFTGQLDSKKNSLKHHGGPRPWPPKKLLISHVAGVRTCQLFKGLCIFLLAQHCLVWASLVGSYSNASHSICKLCQWDIGMTSLRWQSSKCVWHHPLDEAMFT